MLNVAHVRAVVIIAACFLVPGWAKPVDARIVCKNGVQRSSGQWIVTPYCMDALLGKVARQYGMRISDSTLRNNSNRKRHVCRLVGQDIRVRDICRQVNPYGGRFGP